MPRASVDGGFDFAAILRSEEYAAFRERTRGLAEFDPSSLHGPNDRKAFWINLYNGLILDAVLQWRIRRSVRNVSGFFSRAAYNVGGMRFSADDIEHGVLRANSPRLGIFRTPFGFQDPRRQFSLEHKDPRIHFTLVCAARSCPAISVYRAGSLDNHLDQATRAFLEGGGLELDEGRQVVLLSRLFQWYASDFGGRMMAVGKRDALLDFVVGYLPEDRARKLEGSRWSVKFMDYDWSLRGQWSASAP